MSWTAGFQLITVSGYSDNGTSSNCLVSFDIYIYMYVSSTIFSIQWCVKDGQVILFNRHSDLLLSWVQARISWKPTAWKVTGVKYTVYTNPKQLVTIKFKCSKMIPIPETCVVFPVFRNFPFVIWDDWPHPKGWRAPKRTLAVPKGTPILGTKYEFDIAWQRDHNGTWFRKVLFCSRGKPEAKSGHAGIPILRFHRWRWLFWGLDVSTGRSQKIIVSISSIFFQDVCVCCSLETNFLLFFALVEFISYQATFNFHPLVWWLFGVTCEFVQKWRVPQTHWGMISLIIYVIPFYVAFCVIHIGHALSYP